MENFAWPAAPAILGSVAILRTPLSRSIDRIRLISKEGVHTALSLLQSSAAIEANKQIEKIPTAERIQSENPLFAHVESKILEQSEGLTFKDAKEREQHLVRALAAVVIADAPTYSTLAIVDPSLV
jgi:hypothetical protein